MTGSAIPSRTSRAAARPYRAAAGFLVLMLTATCTLGDPGRSGKGGETGAPEIRISDSVMGNYLAGRHARANRDLPAAIQFLMAVLDKDPDNPELLRTTFRLMASEGRIDEALDLARRLVAVDGINSSAPVALAVGDIKGGRFAEAEQRLAQMPERGLNVFLTPLLRAWILVGLGKPDEAIEALDSLSDKNGFRAMRHLHRGLIQELSGRIEEAEKEYRSAAESADGLSLRLIELLGGLYERTGRPEEARALYQEYLEAQPNSRLLDPAEARLDAGSVPKQTVGSAAEGAAEALFGLASALSQQSPPVASLLLGHLALYLRPAFPLALFMVAGTFEEQDRLEKSNALYRAIDPASPLAWSARLRIASSLDRMKRTDEAVALLKEMALQRSDRADPLISMGDIHRSHDSFEDAVNAYDEAIKRIGRLQPRHWSLLYTRGIVLERSKQWARAEKDFLKALDFEPDQPYVLNYLGYSWVELGLNLDRARQMIEKAVDLRPNDGYIVDSLGWVRYRLGDFEAAARDLERAVELRPEDPVINDHLGDAYWRVGRRPEARFQWRRALTLEPAPDLRATIETKIERGLTEETKSDDDG